MPQWGFGMPPPGFEQLIAQKYAMEQQRTDASVAQQQAEAGLTNVRAGLLPGETAADIAKTQAETTGQNITNRFLPGTLTANAFDTAARGLSSLGNYDVSEQQAKTAAGLNTNMSASNLGLL